MLLYKRECFRLRPDSALVERRELIRSEWEGRRRDHRASSENYMREVYLGAGVSTVVQEKMASL